MGREREKKGERTREYDLTLSGRSTSFGLAWIFFPHGARFFQVPLATRFGKRFVKIPTKRCEKKV